MADGDEEKKEGVNFMAALNKMYRSIDQNIIERILKGDKVLKNRYIVDMIDTLYTSELNKDEENREKLKGHIKLWAKGSGVPPNVMATLIKIEKEEEERRQKAERLKYNVAEHNIGEETQAQKLCRLYNIKVDATRADAETLKSDLSAFCLNDKAFF